MNSLLQRSEVGNRHGRWLAVSTAALMVAGGLVRAATESGTNAPAESATNAVVSNVHATTNTVTSTVTNAPRIAAGTNAPTSGRQPTKVELASFKIVTERNIFNSYRFPGIIEGTNGPTKVIPQTEKFALTGTMSFHKGTFAFFDGTKSEYKQVLKQDATIAGYKIVAVSTTGVTLEIDGKQIEFKVGMQMSRPPGGDWTMSLRTDSGMGFAMTSDMRGGGGDNMDFGGRNNRRDNGDFGGGRPQRNRNNFGGNNFGGSTSSFTPEPSSAAASSASDPGAKAEVDDILKKLMQAREQETK